MWGRRLDYEPEAQKRDLGWGDVNLRSISTMMVMKPQE